MADSLSSVSLPVWNGVSGTPGTATNNNPGAFIQGSIGGQATAISTASDYTPAEQSQNTAAYGYLNNLSNSLFGLTPFSPASADSLIPGSSAGQTSASGNSSSISSSISDLFLRGTIIILGFIFVAVGLSMFKNDGVKL